MATRICRTWKFVKDASITPSQTQPQRIMWDLGNEVWEIQEPEGLITHYEIISRNRKEEFVMEEIIHILPECPIPLEAVCKRVGSEWEISSFEAEHTVLPHSPLQSPKNCNTAKTKVRAPVLQPVRPLAQPLAQPLSRPRVQPLTQPLAQQKKAQAQKEKHEHVQEKEQKQQLQMQPKSNKKTEDTYSETSSLPPPPQTSKNLWTSLSQWIPPTALYQPSLHHQAVLELSDKTVHIHISPKQNTRKPRPLPSGPLFL